MAVAAAAQALMASFMEKLKEPLLPVHLVNFLLSLVLFATVANAHAMIGADDECGFNNDHTACSYPWSLGLFAFFFSLACIVVELRWEHLSAYHRYVYVVEMVVGGLLSFLMFIAFCMMASAWSKTGDPLASKVGSGAPGVAIASGFLSVISWAALGYVSYKGYKEDEIGGGGGGMERLGGYVDPVTSTALYHGAQDPEIP